MNENKTAKTPADGEPVQNMKTYEIICPHCGGPHDWTYLKGEWVGLTDAEKNELVDAFYGTDMQRLEAIEAKLKEKNT